MSDSQISEAEINLIEKLANESIVEPTEIDRLLANPPVTADRFKFDGDMSLTRALVHPVLGPALQDFHDRLSWSKEEPELGAGGIETFLLNHSFVHAGYPIIAMPPPRDAADIIWRQTMRLLDPDYREALSQARWKPSLDPDQRWPSMSPVLLARTIQGCITLLKNADSINRFRMSIWKKMEDCLPKQATLPYGISKPKMPTGILAFEEFNQRAEEAVIRAAERYDPDRGAKFTTYAYRRIQGVVRDYFDYTAPLLPLRLDAPGFAGTLEAGPSNEMLFDRLADRIGSWFPGGQKSGVPSDDWLIEGLTDLMLARRRVLQARACLNEREKIIFSNLISSAPIPWKALAARFGVSRPRMSAMVRRTKEKVLAAY
jgi:hypothetical protein